MKHQFARNACSGVLMPILLILARGCSTQQVSFCNATFPLTESLFSRRGDKSPLDCSFC
jgi:hypothetical protein